jgi:photosynthetic reaction center cytochrome c subunit
MLLMTTYLVENWDTYGAIAKTGNEIPESDLVGKVHYREINGQIYNVPGCYTCHGRNSIPKAVISSQMLQDSRQPITILPPSLRGELQP